MAAESGRTLIHYSKKKLTELENNGTSNQRSCHSSSGKPDGFWYAYGEIWKQLVHSGTISRTKENTSFKYEFRLPDSAFVETIAAASRDTIFKLSSTNLNEFMHRFVREGHHTPTTKNKIIEHALKVMIQCGGSAILAELSATDDDFMTYYQELDDRIADEEEIKIKKEIKKMNKFSTLLSTFSPSREALYEDGVSLFNWRAFWKTVSELVGGVEFDNDVITIDTWNDLHLTWTHPIASPSGVIFNPSTFRGGILIEQLRMQTAGGKRYTRKKKSKRTTRKC